MDGRHNSRGNYHRRIGNEKEEIMNRTQSGSKSKNLPKVHKKSIIFVAILLSLFLLAEFAGWSGQIQFYSKWVECGQKPLRAKGSGPMNAGAIHYEDMPSFNVWIPAGTYFCTPLEAEQAGYSADPTVYDFPHIKKAREEGRIQ
jgi:hypothetical protein